jgi:hypothetical protein
MKIINLILEIHKERFKTPELLRNRKASELKFEVLSTNNSILSPRSRILSEIRTISNLTDVPNHNVFHIINFPL